MALYDAAFPVGIASDQPPIAVNVQSTVLPTGAATETTLAAVLAKLPAGLGQALAAASLSVVLASNQPAVPISAAALPLPVGASTETTLAAVSAKLPAALGQALMAASLPVALASNQSALPVTAAALPLPAGASTEATLAALSAKLPAALGQGTMAQSVTVAVASNQSSLPTTEARLPSALGQGTMAASLGVAIASNQSAIPVTVAVLPAALGNGTAAQSMKVTQASDQPSPANLTYSAVMTGLLSAASCTDLFVINGSASKTVRVLRLEVTVFQTTAGLIDLYLVKRSAANTGGTSSAPAALVPHHSTNAAATATVLGYTANPSALGAPVGTLDIKRYWAASTTFTAPTVESKYVWDFRGPNEQPIVLAGVAQGLALGLNGVTVTGGTFTCRAVWQEV